jgi:hypothetical protein
LSDDVLDGAHCFLPIWPRPRDTIELAPFLTPGDSARPVIANDHERRDLSPAGVATIGRVKLHFGVHFESLPVRDFPDSSKHRHSTLHS